jgi:hypothetical protein
MASPGAVSAAAPPVTRVLRLLVSLLILAAVVATYAEASSRVTVNPFNLLGYFTIQSNFILAAAYILTSLPGSALSWTLEQRSVLRACATTYIVIVGIVYATLLAPLGAAGGVPLPWANVVLHVVTPIYGILDWFVFRDRSPLAFRRLWFVLVYPLVWLVVVLIRGATDGWVPYPFLDPVEGCATVVLYAVAIMVVMILFGALVFWISRLGRRGEAAAG